MTALIPKSLPTEVIMEIVTHALDYDFSWDGDLMKPAWSTVEGMSTASKKFRVVVLEAWFRIFKAKSCQDWKSIKPQWAQIYRWARAIYCSHDCCDFDADDLLPFSKLSHVRLDMAGPHFSADVDKIVERIPAIVHHLEIRGLTWPEPLIMQRIARAMPELRTLNLRQPMVWCGLCNTCSISELTTPFPETITYEKGIGLPPHYAKYLSSLQYLHTVRLTIAVADGQHASLDDDNINLWEGECEMCIERLYGDEEFRNKWVEKKKKPDPRPPALNRVEWVLLECTKKYWSEFIDAWPGGE